MLRATFAAALMLASLALPGAAGAQNGPPDSEGGRYSFSRVEDGYLRLDQRTGQVSLCSRRSLGWACHPVPDERAALEEEIARLQKDNAAMKKEMLARGITPPGSKQAEAPAKPKNDLELTLPSDADIDKALSYVERIWRRLVEMVQRLQRDYAPI